MIAYPIASSSRYTSRIRLFALCLFATFLAGLATATPASFETILDGNGDDTVIAIAPTATAYFVVGVTESTDFPVTDGSTPGGGKDLFVAKLGLDGSIVAATRLGGSGDDQATGVVVDSMGIVTVGGWTTSTDFPTTSPLQAANGGGSDCLILQFDLDLSVEFATYLGGAGEEQFAGVAHQTNLDRFVFVGFTTSTGAQFPFPTTNGSNADVTKSGADTDGLLVAMARDRTIPLATYHGITGGNEVLLAVAADPSGLFSREPTEVAVTGYTDSDFFKRSGDPLGSGRKLVAGLLDASTGARLNSRVRSGNGDDQGNTIAYKAGFMTVGGSTTSTDFPVNSSAPQATFGGGTSDGLIVSFETFDFFDSYSTYLGGAGDDTVRGLAYDPSGSLHLAGTTTSSDFPLSLASSNTPAQADYGGGASDGFTGRYVADINGFGFRIVRFGSLSYSGGPEEEGLLATCHRPDGAGVAVNDPYFAVVAGARVGSSPSNAGSRVKKDGITNDQGHVVGLGTGPPPARDDLSVEIRHRYGMPDPAMPRGVPIELELHIFNNGPDTATQVEAVMSIPGIFETMGIPEISPPDIGIPTATLNTGTGVTSLQAGIPNLEPKKPVVVRLLVKTKAVLGDEITSVTLVATVTQERDEADTNPANNTSEAIFPISQNGTPFDLSSSVNITKVPTGGADSDGTAILTLTNNGQHIAEDALIFFRSPTPGQTFVTFTALRPGDTALVGGRRIGKSPILRPGESADFELAFKDTSALGSAPSFIAALATRKANENGQPAGLDDSEPGNDKSMEFYVVGGKAGAEGTVFGDANRDGVQGAGEDGIADVRVTITDSTGEQRMTTTGINGNWMIDGILPGQCALGVSLVADGAQTLVGPDMMLVQLTPGETRDYNIPMVGIDNYVQEPTIFQGYQNAIGNRQHWFSFNDRDWIVQRSEDLINWMDDPEAHSPVLVIPEDFGASEEPIPDKGYLRITPRF